MTFRHDRRSGRASPAAGRRAVPIVYRDQARRAPDGTWKITARDLVVQRWWVTQGYFPSPTNRFLALPRREP